MICLECLTEGPHLRSSKLYCNDTCKHRFHRRQQQGLARGFAGLPVWHHGRFEDYAEVYRGQVQIVLTDPPYGRKYLPIYQNLAHFAATVLAPKGYLICMCGWVELREVMNVFHEEQPGLLPLGQIGYYLLGSQVSTARRAETQQVWRRHHKAVLWYQQPGGPLVHRRSGTTDVIVVPEPTDTEMDKDRFRWEQNLRGFEELVARYTNNEDVICDPMMGTGTTLIAARNMQRPRVIGIEKTPVTYAKAVRRLQEAGMMPGHQERRPAEVPPAVEVAMDPPHWQQLELAPAHAPAADDAAD